MDWKKQLIQNFKLYAITDLKKADPGILEKIEQAFTGGADIVQIRSKSIMDAEMLRLVQKAKQISERLQKLLFVNDRADIALIGNADGVHVGQDDLAPAVIRDLSKKCGRALFIGKSTHSIQQALEAQGEGVDYIGVGPIFSTPTKPGRSAVGLDLIAQVKESVSIPFVAIGGIDETNIREVMAEGAKRVAVVRAIFSAKDVYLATKSLHEKLTQQEKVNV